MLMDMDLLDGSNLQKMDQQMNNEISSGEENAILSGFASKGEILKS